MSDEKTEQPSAKRLRDARQKGQVAKSPEVASALTVMGVAVYFVSMADSMMRDLMVLTEIPMLLMNRPFAEALNEASYAIFILAIKIAGPIVGMVMLVGLIGNLAQVGVMFSMQAAMPKLENISPSKWFKKVFAVKNAVEFLKNILKVAVLGYAVLDTFSKHLNSIFHIPDGNIGSMWAVIGAAAGDMVMMSAGVFCVIAAADYLFQRWQFTKQNMMTKDEVKREYKESEGDPLIKGKRKQLHQEMLAQNTMGSVRKAKVLVTNPTHFAVALDYDKDSTPLPIVLAKGEGALAQRMIEVAKKEGIPIMRNVPLARALFEQGTENAYIPKDLIAPVAEVLRWVQTLGR